MSNVYEENKSLVRTRRLIEAAYGEDFYQDEIVTEWGIGMAEPGYGDEETVWVFGNWNPKRFRREGDAPLTNEESKPVRLANALDKYAGAELLWLDEWFQCQNCYMAFRCEADSYSWTMFGVITEYGDILCGNCVEFSDLEEEYINEPSKALVLNFDLDEEGFELYNTERRYENGWYDGQTDDPASILENAHAEGWEEGVFKVDGVGQFDTHFSLWVR